MTTKCHGNQCVSTLAFFFLAGIASAQTLTITTGPNLGTFPLGTVQVPLTATGGTGTGYVWSITSGFLPAGLTLRTDGGPSYFPGGTTAGIIGVATSAVHNPGAGFTLTVTDSGSNTVSLPCTMSIIPLAITDPNQLADGVVNVAHSYTPTVAGALGSVTWAVGNGNNFPPGLSLNSSTGQISGTPTSQGYYFFNLVATDTVGSVGRQFNMQVLEANFSGSADLGNVFEGATFNTTLTGTGGTPPYTFSAGDVPPGLTLSSGGQLSGTVTGGQGTYRFYVTITDHAGGNFNKQFVLNIISALTLPNLEYPISPDDLTLGEARNYQFNINGGKSPYTWSISGGSLPPGMVLYTANLPADLNLGPIDAVISGAPTQLGTFPFTINVKDSSPTPVTISQPYTLSVQAMTNDFIPSPTRGIAYSAYLRPIGGSPPFQWSIVSGSLPMGLSLNPNTGIISGTPLENGGNFTIFVKFSGGGVSVNRYIGLNANSPTNPPISVNGQTALPDVTVNNQYNYFLNACCGAGGLTFSLVGTAPPGLNLSGNGQLTGTPTAVGRYTLEVQAVDGADSSNYGIRYFTLNVTPLNASSPTPTGTFSSFYTTTFMATGGTGTLTWVLGPGSQPPPGLTLSPGGTLSGTPTSAGSYNLNYIVTDSAGNSFNGYFSVQIEPAGTIAAPNFNFSSNFGTWMLGETQFALNAGGGNGTYTWSLTGGSLPPGLSIRTDTPSFFPPGTQAGIIGVATKAGTYSFTLAVTSGGQTSYQYCTWTITALNIKDSGLPQAYVGVFYSYTFTALNQAGNVTWTQNGPPPAGLTVSSVGVLSGTPTQAGNFNFGYSVSDGVDTVGADAGINVSAVRFTTDGLLPNVPQNGAVNVTFTADGGSGGYTYNANGLPFGLNLSPGGTLSGTINGGEGNISFQVTVTDSSNTSYTQIFSMDLIGTPPQLPSINLGGLIYDPTSSVGSRVTWIVSVQNGGTAPFTWNVTGLPPGMSARPYNTAGRTDIAPGNIEIWGNPTSLGTYHPQYTVTDANGLLATVTSPFTVSALFVDRNDFPQNGTLGTAYSSKLRVLGGTGPYTVSQFNALSNPLPDGLTLNAFTLSGTPLEAGGFNPLFRFNDSAGNSYLLFSGFNIFSGNSSININSYFNLGSVVTGTSYSNQLFACCANSNSYTWTQAGGTLPPGITLATTGMLSGTATASGIYAFLVSAADSTNLSNAGYRQFVIDVTPISITASTNLPYGVPNAPYSYQIQTSGGTGTVTYTLGFQGPLPPGITLSASGLLSGSPTATGQFLFSVNISDPGGHTTVGYFNLSVYATGPPVAIVTGANLGTWSIGEMQYQLIAAGGDGTFAWSTSDSLPPGLSLRADMPPFFAPNASAGIIGVATAAQSAPYQFTLKATSAGQSVSQTFTVKITGLTAMENSGFRLPDAFLGTPFSYTFTPLNGVGNVTFGSPNNLPPGLTLSSAGVLSGTPNTASYYNFNFTIDDTVDTVTVSASLSVNTVNVTSPGSLPNATQNAPYSYTFTAGGGSGSYTFSGNGFPFGLNLDQDGTLSGVPNGDGLYYLNIIATDSNHVSYNKVISLDLIGAPPTLPQVQTNGSFDDCSFGLSCSRGLQVNGGGTAPFVWTVTGLPPGMNARHGSGVTSSGIIDSNVELWGTPLALGTFDVQAVVTDADGVSATQTFKLHVSPLMVDGSDYLPFGTRGAAYSKVLRVLGGIPAASAPLDHAQVQPLELPDGLALSGMTVSGTPVENGNFSPQFTFTDYAGSPNTLTLTENLNIGSGTTTINAAQFGFGTYGSTNDIIGYFPVNSNLNFQLNACCAPSYTWSKTGGSLPPGVSLSAGGSLTGTMTTAGTYTFVVQVADSGNSANFGVRQYTIYVTSFSVTTAQTLPDAVLNTFYSVQLSSSLAANFSRVSGFYLPPGLGLSSSGLISGTPTATGQTTFYVQAVDANNPNDIVVTQFNLAVYVKYPPLFLGVGPTFGPFSPGVHNQVLSASGGKPPYHYSFTPSAAVPPNFRVQDGGQLPSGFPLSATGGLLGVTAGAGTWPTSLRVSDSDGNTFDRPITVIGSSLTILNPNNPPAAVANAAYSYAFEAYGGTGTYTWSATGLPAGITIGSSTGTISGAATGSGNFNINITVTDTSGTAEPFGYNLTVYPFAITTGQVLPQGTVNVSYSQTLAAPNCGSNCNWSMAGGSLPGGLSMTSAGVISGTPNGYYNSSFTVQANGSNGMVQKAFAILVPSNTPQPLYITQNPNLYYSTIGNGYSTALSVQGGTPPYTWSLASGSLPAGMYLMSPGETLGFNFAPGFTYLIGKPSQLGNYSFTLQVTDGASKTTTQTFNWIITPLNFNMNVFPFNGSGPGTYGNATPAPTYGAAYSQQLLVTGGSGNYTSWTTPLAANPLPPGLTLNAATGVVSGTPTATGFYSTLVQVTDDAGNTDQQFINFNVASPTSTTVNINIGPNLGTYASGGNYVFNLNPGGGAGPYTFTVVDSLPPGCLLETGNELLSNSNGNYDVYCAPLAAGTYTFTLRATDSAGNFGVRVLSITFSPLQLYTTTALANGSTSTTYSQQLLAWDNAGTVTWSIAAGSALPPGMTLNGSTLGGSPTTAGSYSFTLTATDSATSSSLNYTFTIGVSTIAITNPTIIPVHAVYQTPYSYQFTATGGGANKNWSANGLPSGLSISTSGLVTGIAENSGSYNVTVTVKDSTSTVTKRFLLIVYYPELLTYGPAQDLMPDARLGQSYSMNLNPSGGTAPFTWTVAPGSSLPPGLSLYSGPALPPNARPGLTILAGEPSAAGQYSFDLIVTDSASPAASVRSTFTLNVTPFALELDGLPNGVINTAYSRQLTAVGGTAPYTFAYGLSSIGTTMLPPGITASASGLISGTPTSTGTYSFSATVTDNAGHSYKTIYSLTVNNSSAATGFAIDADAPFGLSVGIGNDIDLSTNGNSTYTWNVRAGSLPPGMTLSPDGTISGAASAGGTFTFTIRATDDLNSGNFADRQYTVIISPMQLNFQAAEPPMATMLEGYSYQFSIAGGTPPYTFATTPLEPLAPGLSLSSTGLLSGTPTQNGTFSVWAMVTDSQGYTGWFIDSGFAVVRPGQNVPLSSYPDQTHDGSVGVAYSASSGSYSYPLDYSFVLNGVEPVSYSVAPGSSLPPGMTILPGANGVPAYLGGIPTTAGSYAYSLVATDSAGQTVTTQFTTNISPVAVSPKVLPNGNIGTPYSAALSASGGTVPYTFQLAESSDLPPGLEFTAAGVLSGTPTIAGTFNPVVIVTDSANSANTLTFGYTVVIDSNGQAPGIGISPEEVIRLSYVRTAPAPSAVPVNITVTSGSLAFEYMVSGIPGASLSATSGTAPATLTLTLSPTGLSAGTYAGVVGVYAANAVNAVTGIPVVLTVTDPPPCSYTLIPTGGTIAAAGGSGSFNVSSGSLCSWTATTSDAFVTVGPASASGTGAGTVQYSLTGNGGLSSRTGHITVAGQTYSITQFGSSCALSITPSSVSATYAGGLAAVNVTTTNGACTWSASGLGASPASGMGNGAVTFTIPPTSSVPTQTLTATVQLTGGTSSTFTVTQGGISCTVGLSTSSAGASYSGGSGEVEVTTPSGCSYSTVNGPSWISVTSGSTGNGPGPVPLAYSVAANSTTVSRIGTLSIGDKLFTITQDPTPCSVTVDAGNSGSPFGSGGGSGTLAVTANGSNCTWTASSPASWATVSTAFGSGNGTIHLNAGSNVSSTVSRSTNLTVAGQSVAVTQGGTICSYSLGSSNASIPFGGGTGGVTVTAPGACGWTSTPDSSAPWLTISSSGSAGTSDVVFIAGANGTASARSGTLTIAGQPFTVNEAAGPCNYILSGTTATLLAGADHGLFTFSTGTAGCSATAVSFANWLTATTASSADGTSGTVSFTAIANPAGTTRTGTIQFAGQTYTVTQSPAACAFSLNAYGLALGQGGGGPFFVLGSATAESCPVTPGVDQPSIVKLLDLTGPVGGIYSLPFTVASYQPTVGGVRRMVISFGGQLFIIKQTSW